MTSKIKELKTERDSKCFQLILLKRETFRRKRNLKLPNATKKLSKKMTPNVVKSTYSIDILIFIQIILP
ncbi:TPA: hypothetical protein DCP42_01990 [Patescibacteria group bacterium]|nr:hypothetical protein [Patescibacteria group bacterium]